jgi:hypothetical protein
MEDHFIDTGMILSCSLVSEQILYRAEQLVDLCLLVTPSSFQTKDPNQPYASSTLGVFSGVKGTGAKGDRITNETEALQRR